MKSPIKSLVNFFCPDSTNYAHRNRSIEVVALEKNIDINILKQETEAILESVGRIQAIIAIQHRFHVPLSSAWIFVDTLDKAKNI